ncbi:MAG: TraI/MobA(P) family conjugative relaxase [Candidatus Zixiibacteriota bacterium]
MIAKRIERKPEVRDDYSHLGRYIAAAREKGEKLDKFWIVNCDAGVALADLDTALIEIEATRALKPGIADKTYHLVISFRPGDREKLSLEELQDIEQNFAEALGFGEHQRVVGTHINTDNFHMHIAFNKIHPGTLRCHTPRQDFKALAKTCRAMEQKYGLEVDRGMTDGKERNPLSTKARDFEARTWQQSFEGHLREHKDQILAVVAGATSWRELQVGLAEFDATLRKRGAGLVFAEIDGKGRMKASALDRSCSLPALERRLGPFAPAPEREKASPRPKRRPYNGRPLTRHPAMDRLWKTYRQEKKSGFLRRALHMRNWKDYLLAEAHKDALALAIVLAYKELLHLVDEATTPRRPPYRPPKSLNPVLETWFSASQWKAPDIPWLKSGLEDMALRADGEGKTLFPFRDADGRIWAMRALDGLGRTCEIGDVAARPGLTNTIDPDGFLAPGAGYSGPVILTPDCLAAAIMHKGTGAPVVVVATERDLVAHAKSLRDRLPDNQVVVAVLRETNLATSAARIASGQFHVVDGVQAHVRLIAEMASRGRPVAVDQGQAAVMGALVEDALSLDDVQGRQTTKGKGGLNR